MLVSGKSHSHVFGCHIVGIWRFHFTRLRKKGLSIVKLMSAVYLESSYIHVTTWICFFKFSLLWVKLIMHRWFVVKTFSSRYFTVVFYDLFLLLIWYCCLDDRKNMRIWEHRQNPPALGMSVYFIIIRMGQICLVVTLESGGTWLVQFYMDNAIKTVCCLDIDI